MIVFSSGSLVAQTSDFFGRGGGGLKIDKRTAHTRRKGLASKCVVGRQAAPSGGPPLLAGRLRPLLMRKPSALSFLDAFLYLYGVLRLCSYSPFVFFFVFPIFRLVYHRPTGLFDHEPLESYLISEDTLDASSRWFDADE